MNHEDCTPEACTHGPRPHEHTDGCTARIDAARTEPARTLAPFIADYIGRLDSDNSDEDTARITQPGPRLFFVYGHTVSADEVGPDARHANLPGWPEPAKPYEHYTQLACKMEPEDMLDPAIWTDGLATGLWVHSDRLGKICLEGGPEDMAELGRDIIAAGVVTREILTRKTDGKIGTRYAWHACDVFGNAYLRRRGVAGWLDGTLETVTGWMNEDWPHDELVGNAYEFHYTEAHVALLRILSIVHTPYDRLEALARDGAFEVPPAILQRLAMQAESGAAGADHDGGGALDGYAVLRRMVASYGFTPLAALTHF